MNPDPEEIVNLIMSAREALQRGDTDSVKRLAQQAASIEPESEVALLLLALASSPEDSLAYVHKALEIDPDSEPARQALTWAQSRLPEQPADEPPPVDVETPALDAEADLPANESGNFADIYQPLDEPSPAMVAQSEQPDGEILDFEKMYAQPAADGLPALDVETEFPADEPESFDEVYQQLDEPELDRASWTVKTRSAPTAEKMHPAIRPENLTDSGAPAARADKKGRLSPALLLFSALGVLIIAVLAGWFLLRPLVTNLWAGIFPADPCQASLVLGTRSFQVRTLKSKSDGSYVIPSDQPEQAYWVEGSDDNAVFMISPADENLALMAGLQPGDPIAFTRPDCNMTSYSMSLAVPADLDMPALLDQSRTGLTIIIPLQGSSSGYVLLGELQ